MAFKSVFCVLVLVGFLSMISIPAEARNDFNLAMASRALSDKGYQAMSMILDVFFKTHDVSDGNSSLTVFAPADRAFFSSKYPQPPLTLLEYHAVPLKLDSIEAMTSLPYGSKIGTLLFGHPLVVTTLLIGEELDASLNGVRITEWNVYNDGGLIIHGVDDFFDPAFQTLIYPWFDFDVKKDIHEQVVSGLAWRVKELIDNPFLLLAMVVIGMGLLVLSFCCSEDNIYEDKEYESLKQREEEDLCV